MHPKKRELLDTIAESAAATEDLMRHLAGRAVRPDVHGWRSSLRAALPLPLIGFNGVCHGIAYLAASHTKESTWERSYPTGKDVTDVSG